MITGETLGSEAQDYLCMRTSHPPSHHGPIDYFKKNMQTI